MDLSDALEYAFHDAEVRLEVLRFSSSLRNVVAQVTIRAVLCDKDEPWLTFELAREGVVVLDDVRAVELLETISLGLGFLEGPTVFEYLGNKRFPIRDSCNNVGPALASVSDAESTLIALSGALKYYCRHLLTFN